MMKKLPLKVTLLALVATNFYALPAQAEDREWVSYKKLVESTYLDKFYRTEPSQRDQLRMLLQIVPRNKAISPSTVVLTVVHGGIKDKLPINAEGIMEFEPNQEWIKEDAMVYTNLPKDEKSGVGAIFASKTPQSLQLSYAELMASVPQWNTLIKEQAGVLRFMAPKFNAVHLHFAKPAQQSLQIVAKDGTKTYTADPKGELKLQLNDAMMKANPQILLSEKPGWVEVDEL
jgi:hypothetical protein